MEAILSCDFGQESLDGVSLGVADGIFRRPKKYLESP